MLEGDYFDLENGKEVHNWQKTVFNGTESWERVLDTFNRNYYFKLDNILNAEKYDISDLTIRGYSNYYVFEVNSEIIDG